MNKIDEIISSIDRGDYLDSGGYDAAKADLLSALKAGMPKHDPYYQNKVENKTDEQLRTWHNRTVGYNQALDDVTKALDKMFKESEE